MIRNILAAFLAMLVVSGSVLAQRSAAGTWRVEFVTPLGQTGVNMTINQSGTRLTGQVTDEYGEYPIAGDWILSVTSPQGTNSTKVTFTQDGEKVSGLFKGPAGELPFTGTLIGSDLSFKFTIQVQGMPLDITLTGKLEGETLSGKADFGGFAEGDWKGKRDTAESTPTTPAPPTTTESTPS